MRYLLALLLLVALVAGGLFVYAGRMPGPAIEIAKPTKYVGASTPLEVQVTAPQGKVTKLDVAFEQNGKQTPLFSLEKTPAAAPAGTATASVQATGGATPAGAVVTATITRENVPDLKSGPARIVVTAERPVLFGMRKARSTATRDVTVRLEKPTIAVLSTKHYINLGGSEMVVYRATPADVESGVMVGDLAYPGYPASGAKMEGRSHRRSRGEGRFHRAALGPGRQHADARLREGRSGQQRARRLRSPRVPQAVQEEHDPDRRQVHQQGGAVDLRELP